MEPQSRSKIPYQGSKWQVNCMRTCLRARALLEAAGTGADAVGDGRVPVGRLLRRGDHHSSYLPESNISS